MNWVFSPAPMLNVYQLMIAFWLPCVTVTVEVPCPAMVACPPTTWPPSGLANAPGGAAISAVARSETVRDRIIAAPLVFRTEDEEETRVLADAVNCVGDLQVGVPQVHRPDANAGAGRGGGGVAAEPYRRIDRGRREQPQPAVVDEGVELDLVEHRRDLRHVVAQLADRLEAVVAEQLRGIVGAAEEAAAVAALLGDQQRIEGVLAVDRAECREGAPQRLRAAERRLDLLEVDAAELARGRRLVGQGVVVVGAAEPLDALAVGHVDLVDAEQAVGPVAIGFQADAAQAVLDQRQLFPGEIHQGGVVAHEGETCERQVLLARADDVL